MPHLWAWGKHLVAPHAFPDFSTFPHLARDERLTFIEDNLIKQIIELLTAEDRKRGDNMG